MSTARLGQFIGWTVIIIIYGGLAGIIWLGLWMDGKHKLCSIETPVPKGIFEVFTENFQDIPPQLYFEVRADGKVQVPMTHFWSVPYDTSVTAKFFVVRAGKEGALVGLALASEPDQILVMHDFATNENWTRRDSEETPEVNRERGEIMLDRLKKETSDNGLELGLRGY